MELGHVRGVQVGVKQLAHRMGGQADWSTRVNGVVERIARGSLQHQRRQKKNAEDNTRHSWDTAVTIWQEVQSTVRKAFRSDEEMGVASVLPDGETFSCTRSKI